MESWNIRFILVLGVAPAFVAGSPVSVITPVGEIIGFEQAVQVQSRLLKIRKFMGIPYAEAPIGDLRFAKPVPKGNFTSPFDASRRPRACYQKPVPQDTASVSEDCLVLNIYSPDRPTGMEQYPVMIWIHGGGFVEGTSIFYNSDYLSSTGQVIVATINYRLAELGFLSTGDGTVPGNAGLWDQHLAIKWVNRNIKSFGGDISRVTIFGQSAGSESVTYQTMYPGNRGLFQRAIGESGSATSPWSLKTKANAIQDFVSFAKLSGCLQPTNPEMVACLRSKTSEEINATMNGNNRASKVWRPVIDDDFVMDFPAKILKGTSLANSATEMFESVDLMMGVNNKDGLIDLFTWRSLLKLRDSEDIFVSRSQFQNILIPHYLNVLYRTNTSDIVKQLGILEYTDWSDPDDNVKRLNKLTDLVTQIMASIPATEVANSHVQMSDKSTYMYEFSVPMYPEHIIGVPQALDGPTTANHGDELGYLFRLEDMTHSDAAAKSLNLTTEEYAIVLRVSRVMITMWTNFAKSGNPNRPVDATMLTNAIWPQYGLEENYLEITPVMTSHAVKQHLAPRAMAFFKKVLPAVMNAEKCAPCPSLSSMDNAGLIIG